MAHLVGMWLLTLAQRARPLLDGSPGDSPALVAIAFVLVTATAGLLWLAWRLTRRYAGVGLAALCVSLGTTVYALALLASLSPVVDALPPAWGLWLQRWLLLPTGLMMGAWCGAGVATLAFGDSAVRRVGLTRAGYATLVVIALLQSTDPFLLFIVLPLSGLLATLGGLEVRWLGAAALPPGARS